MKKIIFLIGFIVCWNSTFSQQHKVELYDLNYEILKGVKNTTENSKIEIKVYLEDGTSRTLYYRDIRNRGEREVNYTAPVISVFSRPIKIDCYVFVNFRTGTDAESGIPPKDPIILNSSCVEDYYENTYSPRMTKIEFNYRITPILSLNNPGVDNLIGFEDPFTLSATDGFTPSVYNWQYQAVESGPTLDPNWVNMPASTNGLSSFDITPSTFLLKEDVGKTIYFRINSCNNIYSELPNVFYDLRESAPHITTIETVKTTCYDSEDGSVKLTFDRALASNLFVKALAPSTEFLSIRIEDLSVPEGTNPDGSIRYRRVGGQDNISALDADNSITIGSLPKSTTQFKIILAGTYNGVAYYTDGTDHTRTFTIDFNPPVAFLESPKDSKVDVWCFGGEDGEVTLKAQGGTADNYHYQWRIAGGIFSDWIPFDSPTSDTQILKNLGPNVYQYKISDGNVCVARDQTVVDGVIKLGDDIIEEVEILAPENELLHEYTDSSEPTAFGLQDGYIVAEIKGGTIKDDNTYDFEWKDENGVVLTSTTTEFTSGAFYITLNTIGAGSYTLTITDKNYNNATDKDGCTITESSYFLDQPKPLAVTIEILESISCNSTNEYNSEIDDDTNGIPNEAQDGALVAHAEGGIQLDNTSNNGLPYFYTWKKKDTSGNWVELSETDSIIRSLNVGDYALNIKDKNGIVLGEYVNNALVREIDSTFYLPEPPRLEIVTTANEITCSSGNNGYVKTVVSGGTPPYSYVWNTGDETEEVTDLIAGTYFVYVTDAKGCQIQDNITIIQPDGMEIELLTKVDPTCSYSTDGKIEVNITGGVAPYTLEWNSGATTATIENLIAGFYELTITDANNCKTFFEATLESTTPLEVDLGDDRTLCGGQIVTIDASIEDVGASYEWSGPNEFSSNTPMIDVTDAGVYKVTVSSSKGCMASDEINITTKNIDIDSSFLLTSQAYTGTSIELANVSYPKGESTEWLVPDEALIIEENEDHLVLQFSEVGEYEVSLISFVEDCYKVTTKNILVEENTNLPDVGDADNPFIVEFVVYPNPNNGVFNVKIVLAETSAISLRLVSMLNYEVMTRKEEIGNIEYEVNYNTNLASGVYFIILETPEGTETRKVIIQ